MDFREVIIVLIVFAIIYGGFLAWKIFNLTPNNQRKKNATRRQNVHFEPGLNRRESDFPRSTQKNFYDDDDDDDENVLDLSDPRAYQEQCARTFHERAHAFQERRHGNPDTRPYPRTERRTQPQSPPPQQKQAQQQRRNAYTYEPPELNLQPSHLAARIDSIEQQMVSIRQGLLEIRTNLAHFSESTAQELERLRNMQAVSPMYNEAMRLAGSGYNAQEISQRCGMTLAEAELVSALARSQGDFNNGGE